METEAIAHSYPSYSLCGAKITPSQVDDLLNLLALSITAREQCIVAAQNMHGLWVHQQSAVFRELHRLSSTYVHIDGMPLVLLARLVGIKVQRNQRVTAVDLIWPLLELAEREHWRLFYLGSTPGVCQRAIMKVKQRLPNLNIVGHHGYWDKSVYRYLKLDPVAEIERFQPHLILVGMGMGVQEGWILQNHERVAPSCLMVVGACFEYLAGYVSTPPRWLGQVGLEWLWRLSENPRRFWRRYLIEPWSVAGEFLRYVYDSRW